MAQTLGKARTVCSQGAVPNCAKIQHNARGQEKPQKTKSLARSEAMRKRWQDREYAAAMADLSRQRMLAQLGDQHFLARLRTGYSAYLADDDRKAPLRARAAKRMSALWLDPGFRERRLEAVQASLAHRQGSSLRMARMNRDPSIIRKQKAARRGIGVEIPGWVPRELWDDYLDLASMYGEEIAASYTRTNKAIAS